MCHGFSTANLLIATAMPRTRLGRPKSSFGEGSHYATALPETVAISAVLSAVSLLPAMAAGPSGSRLEFGGISGIIRNASRRSGGMKRRIAIWAGPGLVVAGCWALYASQPSQVR